MLVLVRILYIYVTIIYDCVTIWLDCERTACVDRLIQSGFSACIHNYNNPKSDNIIQDKTSEHCSIFQHVPIYTLRLETNHIPPHSPTTPCCLALTTSSDHSQQINRTQQHGNVSTTTQLTCPPQVYSIQLD